jgi:hypothetical protein
VNVRPASFRDLARIEQLYSEAGSADELPAQLLPDHPVPQATLLRLWYAVSKTVSSLVPFTAGASGDTLFVAETPREGIVGFIQAQAPTGRSDTLQILNLCVTGTATGHFAREQLLTHLTNHGLEHGVHRFLVRLPLDDALVGLFLERGFVQFATEQILYCDDVPAPGTAEGARLRPARREDVGAIYLLYLRTTPSHVASLEGSSLKSWQSGFADGTMARMGRDDSRHYVAEDPGVVGWAAIRPASATRPTLLSLMCDGHHPRLREAVVDGALRELPPGPVSSVLRHYDSELIRSLQRRGFAIYGTQVLLVRDLASRVRLRSAPARKKPVLIRAHLAQTVPAPTPTLRVLSRRSERSPRP